MDQLAEAREMLSHYVKELRQVKAQRDELCHAVRMALQHWEPGTTPSDKATIQILRVAIALTQKEEA